MPILPMPSADAEREHDEARWNPERETLELATAGAAQVLGPDHGVSKALARASITMTKVDLWRARLAVKTRARTSARPSRRQGKAVMAGAIYPSQEVAWQVPLYRHRPRC